MTRPTFAVASKKTARKIALEGAISTHGLNPTVTLSPASGTAELPYVDTNYVADVKDRLTNVEARVKSMDEAGVDLTIVSLTMPKIEGIFDPAMAVETAKKVNDEIHQLYTAGPFAKRATEAARCVKELGFLGFLVNGFSNIGDADTIQYLDEPQLSPVWDKLVQLDVPLYVHPRIPAPSQICVYKGYEFLGGSPWGLGVETASHAIRLMMSGLFDRYPSLKISLGHCGEGIPFSLNRIDHRLRHFQPRYVSCKKQLHEYWENNFYITTAGVMDDGTFHDTLRTVGENRLMWSVDYPYEDYNEHSQWFDNLDISENTRAKIGWANARRILKLD